MLLSLHIKTKRYDAEPVIMGPVMLITNKDPQDYQSMLQRFVLKCPDLSNNFKPYGADGEAVLIQAYN